MTDLTLTSATPAEAAPKTLTEQVRAYVIENLPVNATLTDADVSRAIGRIIGFIASTKLAPQIDGEPIFVLRAQDKIAPFAVMCWASEAEAYGCTPENVAGARTIAAEMCAWALAHPSRVKRPD